MKVIWLRKAESDLDAVFEYIAQHNSTAASSSEEYCRCL